MSDRWNAFVTRTSVPGQGDGDLTGWRIGVKDNIDVAGVPTTAGSPAFTAIPPVDATAVAALRRAGASVVGKTNMHELALGVTSNNATFGAVLNPADDRFSAGGSSGGSAAAVAAGLVRAALSTDTGGSVTIPASFCGVVGFRPTTGRYPADGTIRLSSSRDTIGLHARTLADARTLDAVIVPGSPSPERIAASLRIGVVRARFQPLDAGVDAVVRTALDRMREAGVELVDVDTDLSGNGTGEDLVLFEAATLLLERLPGVTLDGLADRVASPDVRAILRAMIANPVGAAAYDRARRDRRMLRAAYGTALSGLDALISPACPVPPPRVGVDDIVVLDGRPSALFPTLTRNTLPGTTAGVPMLTLPVGCTSSGLPVGVLLEGGILDDRQLLAVGSALESVIAQPTHLG